MPVHRSSSLIGILAHFQPVAALATYAVRVWSCEFALLGEFALLLGGPCTGAYVCTRLRSNLRLECGPQLRT